MKVILVRGDERVEIEGSDELIKQSICYQHSFEGRVAEILKHFYGATVEQEAP